MKRILLFVLMMNTSAGEKFQSVMKAFSKNIGDEVLICQATMKFKDSVIHDFLNFWNDKKELQNKELGCVMSCILDHLEFLYKDSREIQRENVKAFSRSIGADNEMALKIVDLFQLCKKVTSHFTETCESALEVTKCFRYGIFQLHWAPEKPKRHLRRTAEQPTIRLFNYGVERQVKPPMGRPAKPPAERSVGRLAEQLITRLVERSNGRPGEQPIGPPAERPIGRPAERPNGRSAKGPVGQPAVRPIGQPADRQNGQPVVRPNGRPIGQPADRPNGQPAVRPNERPAELSNVRSVERPNGRPAERLIGRPAERPNRRPPERPIGQPVERPRYRPKERSAVQPPGQLVNRVNMKTATELRERESESSIARLLRIVSRAVRRLYKKKD